jgi:hypothetical protein
MLMATFSSSASAQSSKKSIEIPVRPVIEAIAVEGVSEATTRAILDRIGLRVGDDLTIESRHQLGKQLGVIDKNLTFSYTHGTKSGTVRLRIRPC